MDRRRRGSSVGVADSPSAGAMATTGPQPSATAAHDDPATSTGRDERTQEALARSRELRARSRQLLANTQRIAPAAAAVVRARRRAGIGNGPQPGGQQLTAALDRQVEEAKAARARLAALAADLATTEDNVAHVHDQLAARYPENAARYHQAADGARGAARRAREFQRTATDGTTGISSGS